MKKAFLIFTGISFFLIYSNANSQGLLDKIKDKVQDRVEQKTDEAIDKGIDKVEEEATKEDEAVKEDENKNQDELKTEESNEAAENEQSAVKPNKQDLKSFSKYDFIPGEKVVFYEDFSQDNVGDFPALWNTDGSGEVVTTNNYPGKWLKLTGNGSFIPDYHTYLPENFTVEFDVIPDKEGNVGLYLYDAENPDDFNEGGAIPGKSGIKLWFNPYNQTYDSYAEGNYGTNGSTDIAKLTIDKLDRISVWVQKRRIRIYINEIKAIDAPRALPEGQKFNCLRFLNHAEDMPMITNIRVAVGLPDMRNKLLTEGKLVTHGILFDVNSDKIKPESYGTIKEISKVLTENSDVKVKIVGHTDSDGSDAANLDLSKRRAASVKTTLNKDFGIDEARMETDGKGESEPIDKNASPSGKANNRRVEFLKL